MLGTIALVPVVLAVIAVLGPVAQASATIVGTGNTISPAEGAIFSGAVATFTDTNGDSVATLHATIAWGDGTTTSGTVTGSSPNFTVSGSHTYADEGSVSVGTTLAQNSPATGSGTATGTANVAEGDAPAGLTGTAITPTEGTAFSGQVASFTSHFTGNTASDFTATIHWGDGTSSVGTVSGGSGSFTISGTHTYTDECSCSFTVTVADDPPSSLSLTAGNTATVGEGDFGSLSPQTISSVEGLGTFTLVKFTDAFDNSAADFTATINWGDGTTSAGQVVKTGIGAYEITGAHSYVDGSYTYSVSFSDDPPSTLTGITVTGAVTIAEGHLQGAVAFAPVEGHQFTGRVAAFTDEATSTAASDYTATIDWGDGTITPGQISGSSGTFAVDGSHTYAEECTCNATVAINRLTPTQTSVSPSAGVTVQDAPLTGSVTVVSSSAFVNGAIAKFTDANGGAAPEDFTATIDWGDGSAASPGAISTDPAGGFDVSAAHTWTGHGPFTAHVRIADQGGASTDSLALKPAPAIAPPPAKETVATITHVRATPSTFAAGKASTPVTGSAARARKSGTVFSFVLDQPAIVVIKLTGPIKRRRAPAVATLARIGRAGRDKIAFTGRVNGKRLPPGRYSATFTAIDAAGTSRPHTLSLKIVRH